MGRCGSQLRTDRPSCSPLSLAREDPEQRDNEVDAQVRLEVSVRLAAARGRDRRGHIDGRRILDVWGDACRGLRQDSVRGIRGRPVGGGGGQGVRVVRYLLDGKVNVLDTAALRLD